MIEEIERIRWRFPGIDPRIARILWDKRKGKKNRWIVLFWTEASGDVNQGAFLHLGTALRCIQREAGYIE
jgi:hypothetical protein